MTKKKEKHPAVSSGEPARLGAVRASERWRGIGHETDRERHPPLARLDPAFGTRVVRAVDVPLDEPEDSLLARLREVTPERVGREPVTRRGAGEDLIQREAGFARQRELREGVRRQVLRRVLRAPGPSCDPQGEVSVSAFSLSSHTDWRLPWNPLPLGTSAGAFMRHPPP